MGKISFTEGLILVLGLLWLLGFFRKLSVSDGSTRKSASPPPPRSRVPKPRPSLHKPPRKRYGDDQSEYVDYEDLN